MKQLFIISLFCYSLIFCSITNNYNSLFYFAKSPKTNSLSSIHFPSTNISGIFYQPISNERNMKNDYYFSFTNQYDNQIEIIQFSYCIKHDNKKNLSLGFIKRNVKNIYNTASAWSIEDFSIPEFSNIDYNKISNLSYQDMGFILSYNKYLNNKILNLKIKPFFNSIDSNKAIGVIVDLITNYKITNLNMNFILGINNLLSFKKWSTGIREKNKIEFFASSTINLDKINLYFESNNIYNNKIALEYKIQEMFYIRLGKEIEDVFTYGFGLSSDFIELNYAYLDNNILGNSSQISILFKLDSIDDLKNNINF